MVPLRLHQPDCQAKGEVVLLEVYAALQEEEVMMSPILELDNMGLIICDWPFLQLETLKKLLMVLDC